MTFSYEIYISEIKNQILPPEEEVRLIKVYKNRENNWEEAQDLVIKSNLMFVVKTAFSFTNDPCKISDLISEGNVALLYALDKFNPDLGVKLITYASMEIRGRMLRHLISSNHFSAFKLSKPTRDLSIKIKSFCDEYSFKHGTSPSKEIIKKEFGVDDHNASLYLEMASVKTLSVNQEFQTEDGSNKPEIKDDQVITPDEETNTKDLSKIILKIIANLPLRERTVITRRFGLNGEEESDLLQIGLQFGLTKERIRQIESSVLKTIRKEMEKLKLTKANGE
jgi:RNA polymerase sigma factor (sigma-70 family)